MMRIKREEKLKRKSDSAGFTLVEVILVVAIITIISAIAVPQVGKYMNKANRSKVVGAIAELNNSAINWSIDNSGDMPPTLTEVLQEQGDLKRLGIGLQNDGKFSIGNIKGKVEYSNGEVFAKIDTGSKAFPGEEIRK